MSETKTANEVFWTTLGMPEVYGLCDRYMNALEAFSVAEKNLLDVLLARSRETDDGALKFQLVSMALAAAGASNTPCARAARVALNMTEMENR